MTDSELRELPATAELCLIPGGLHHDGRLEGARPRLTFSKATSRPDGRPKDASCMRRNLHGGS